MNERSFIVVERAKKDGQWMLRNTLLNALGYMRRHTRHLFSTFAWCLYLSLFATFANPSASLFTGLCANQSNISKLMNERSLT